MYLRKFVSISQGSATCYSASVSKSPRWMPGEALRTSRYSLAIGWTWVSMRTTRVIQGPHDEALTEGNRTHPNKKERDGRGDGPFILRTYTGQSSESSSQLRSFMRASRADNVQTESSACRPSTCPLLLEVPAYRVFFSWRTSLFHPSSLHELFSGQCFFSISVFASITHQPCQLRPLIAPFPLMWAALPELVRELRF